MIHWANLAPQIAVALAIIVAVAFLLRVVMGLAKSMTKPGLNGTRESRLGAIEGNIQEHGRQLHSHGKMMRKQFAAMATLRLGQNEILEHLTNGQPSTTADIPLDIDAADTGEYLAYTGDEQS